MAAVAPTLEKQTVVEVDPIILHFKPVLKKLSDDEFLEFCNLNEGWRFEVTRKGDLEIMMPSGPDTSKRNAWLISALVIWAEKDGTGQYFESNAMFKLPNGAKRSPDLSWISNERWETVKVAKGDPIRMICPDFVVELRSWTDRLKPLKKKMQEYMDNGAQLGWLIDPRNKKIYVYRPDAPVEELDEPETLSGEPLLPGFVLPTDRLWQK